MADFADSYTFLDRLLHRFAFKTTKMQLGLADNESEEHRAQLNNIQIDKPVFITSLPRSGTTILLDVLSKTEQFSYHSYQDMPFIFTPLLWSKFSRNFAKSNELTERAHKDGIKINQQSPEAFEEMLFKAFWPKLYDGASLPLWPEQPNAKFDTFFAEHIKKLLFRDGKGRDSPVQGEKSTRYISKNNLNITRLPYLKKLFPDGILLVPFRDPLQHALSLLRQHQNFTKLHGQSKFAKDYMAAVGHFDFGANLKPVNFSGWFDNTAYQPDSLDFWLEYWVMAYQHIVDNHKSFCHFVCFETLCAEPKNSFITLAEVLAIEPQTLIKSIGVIKVAKTHAVDVAGLNADTVAKAQGLYRDMVGIAVN
ncbi:MAG: sulfotransferase, partial [Psychrosphaera sp.]|nr:sulfotransferase [Psychrosphaera sp.]